MKRKALVIALSLLNFSAYAADNSQELENITVRAEPANPPTRSVSQIDSKQIQNKNPKDLKALLNNEMGVEVDALPRLRQGNDSVNIRGLNGNRVGMDIDGIPLPESQESRLFSTVGMAFGRGNFVENASLSSVQIQRGAQANGLAGSLKFRTLSPDDVLTDPNRNWGAYINSQYNSADKSVSTTATGALQQGAWQGLLLGTYTRGHETKTHGKVGGTGATRTEANPSDYNSRYLLTKHDFDLNAQNRITFTGEYLKRKQSTENLSGYGRSGQTNITQDSTQDDNTRKRISLAHRLQNSGSLKDAQTQIYYQDSRTDNYRYRSTPRTDIAYTRDKVFGANGEYTQAFSGSLKPQIRYGFQFAHHDLQNELNTTSITTRNAKPFANTKQTQAALFAESELTWQNFVFTPALRWDYYRLNPSTSDGFTQLGSDTTSIAKQHDHQISPRLGILWKASPDLQPYFQYSRGFKAPSTQQVTTSFGQSLPQFGVDYAVVGNPNLKAETANNFELGLRGNSGSLNYQIAAFDNRYRNFIDFTKAANSTDQALRIQYQNLDKARIYGGEANATWQFAPNWKLNGGLSYARGYTKDSSGKLPINSVMPFKAKLGAAYEQEKWGVNALASYSARKSNKDISSATFTYNPSRAYALLDLGGYWQPSKNLRVTANVNNVFNRKYWNWADLSHFAARTTNSAAYDNGVTNISATNADAYTATGRNFNVGVRYTF